MGQNLLLCSIARSAHKRDSSLLIKWLPEDSDIDCVRTGAVHFIC